MGRMTKRSRAARATKMKATPKRAITLHAIAEKYANSGGTGVGRFRMASRDNETIRSTYLDCCEILAVTTLLSDRCFHTEASTRQLLSEAQQTCSEPNRHSLTKGQPAVFQNQRYAVRPRRRRRVL